MTLSPAAVLYTTDSEFCQAAIGAQLAAPYFLC